MVLVWRCLPSHSQDSDPECTIFVRDHDLLDFEEDGRQSRSIEQRFGNASERRNGSKPPELLAKEDLPTKDRGGDRMLFQQQGRTAVAASAEGITVAWHEGRYIWLRRFSHSCRSRSMALVVSKSTELGRAGHAADLGTGLGDVATLSDGRVAVAWTVDGDVWVRVMQVATHHPETPIRVSAEGRRQRKEVTLTATHDFNGFVVAWSTWGEDGDGWGISARMFNADGVPTGAEQQVNTNVHGSQRHPQLFACTTGAKGPAVWASWLNGTLGNAHEFYVRRLGSRSFNFGPEIRLAAPDMISVASIMCASGSSTQNPSVIWANGRERKVQWATIVEPPSKSGRSLASTVSSVSLEDRNRRGFLSQDNRTTPSNSSASGAAKRKSSASRMIPSSTQVRAEGDVLSVATNDEFGGLTVRIFDMAPIAAYPSHQVTFAGAKLERIAYDVTLDQALILCFSHRSGITCERRHLQSLMESEAEQLNWWLAILVFFVFVWFRNECFGDKDRSSHSQHSLFSSAGISSRERGNPLRIAPMLRPARLGAGGLSLEDIYGLSDDYGHIGSNMARPMFRIGNARKPRF